METQAFDADGHVVTRTLRTYDEKQRITDVQVIIEEVMSLFSSTQQAEMVAPPGVSLEEMKAEMKSALSVLMAKSGKSCTYDSNGRRTKIVLHQGAMGEFTRTYSYNEHGDVVEERITHTTDARIPAGVSFRIDEAGNLLPNKPPIEWPPQTEIPDSIVHYAYQYDNFGNWTEQTQTRLEGSRSGPEYTRRRELTYY